MKARIFALMLALAMLLCVFTACGNSTDVLTSEQAQQIALEEAGLSADEATNIHTHIVTEDGIPCFNVHISAGDEEFSYLISAADGTIIASGDQVQH